MDGGGDAVQCSTVFFMLREKRLTLERVETATHLNPPGRFFSVSRRITFPFFIFYILLDSLELV